MSQTTSAVNDGVNMMMASENQRPETRSERSVGSDVPIRRYSSPAGTVPDASYLGSTDINMSIERLAPSMAL